MPLCVLGQAPGAAVGMVNASQQRESATATPRGMFYHLALFVVAPPTAQMACVSTVPASVIWDFLVLRVKTTSA